MRRTAAITVLALLAAGAPAGAQTTADPAAKSAPGSIAGPADNTPAKTSAPSKPEAKRPQLTPSPVTSPNATINLVNILVKQGILKEEQAQALIKQADQEAYVARQAAKDASARAEEAAKAASAASAAASPPGTRHVTYVPEIVKRELREEIRKEVMAKAEKENWASPGAYPEWAQRIHFYGDIRARYEGLFFPKGNDQANAINFNAINTGSPYDASAANTSWFPTYNATQDRNQPRLWARLGMDADLSNGFSADIRIASGDTNSPVATTTLGVPTSVATSTVGGDFSRYSMWLDRAALHYHSWNDNLAVSLGRFDNPFWSPTDLVWYSELGFDGVAVQARYAVTENFEPFAVAGAFPLYTTDYNAGFSTASPDKLSSNDKWLYGGQIGFAERFASQSRFKLAAAFYDFDNVQGQLSDPCVVVVSSDVCNTDLSRPSFAQKGNTYMPLRNIVYTATNNYGAGPGVYQYFGLVGQYRPVVVNAELDLGTFHPYHILLDGEYLFNTAFNRGLMNEMAINNRGGTADASTGSFNGGNQGWMTRLTVGDPVIHKRWDWNVYAAYKYLQSDATVDAFTDPDFGYGGTNLKGYIVGGRLGLSDNVWTSLKWMSANNISGSPFAIDILMLDLAARF